VTPVTSGRGYRFGKYLLDSPNHRVLLDGAPLPLAWRCFDALMLLVDAQGAVVNREVLFQKLWPGIEVEETSLTKVMSQLRRVLAEGDPTTEYIETVPRIGYRLCVPVLPDNVIRVPAANQAGPFVLPPAVTVNVTSRRGWLWGIAAVILLLAVIAGTSGWKRYQRLAEAERASKEGQQFRRAGRDPNSLRGAIESFRKATQLDPGNAAYFGELAAALSQVPYAGQSEWSAARDAAERGIQLDRNCGACQSVLGFVLFSRFWDWDKAGTHLREGLRLAPQSAGIHGYMAMYLSSQGRPDEALKHADECVRLDPYFATGHYIRSLVLFFLRRYPESAAAADRSLSIRAGNPGPWDAKAFALLQQKRDQDALNAWIEVQWPERDLELRSTFRAKGMPAALGVLLNATADGKLRETNVYRRARWRMYLGDPAGALDDLELALKTRQYNLMYIAADPMFESLRPNATFHRIISDMGLGHLLSTPAFQARDPGAAGTRSGGRTH
jgi:DNA-binding winged helix-turn-helix (wHTH) protein/tetratricopeptide (TPR) repeat protein